MRTGLWSILLLFIIAVSQHVDAQKRISLTPGFFYNGTTLRGEVSGVGAIIGLEYMPREDYFFSLELRSKYGYYVFDDGTNWSYDKEGRPIPPLNTDEARVKYALFSAQAGLVPKFYLHFDEFSLFLENEFSPGLMSGKFAYKGAEREITFTEPTFSYNIGVGVESAMTKCILTGSLGYSTLNFRKNIRKHQPPGYNEYLPDQNAAAWISLIFKIPLARKGDR